MLTLDGKYYLGEFDEKAGGECSTSLSKDFTKIDFDRDDDEWYNKIYMNNWI